jgi:hypothetical protein
MSLSATPAPRSIWIVLAEIGGALLGGVIVGAIAGWGAGALLSGAGLGMGLLTVMIYAVIVGFGVGAGAGAALAGRLLGQTGSPWLAVLGGALAGVVISLALRYLPLRIDLFSWPIVAAPLVVGCAVVGYNLRRQPPRDDRRQDQIRP